MMYPSRRFRSTDSAGKMWESYRILQENTRNRWDMEAVFRPQIIGKISFRNTASTKSLELPGAGCLRARSFFTWVVRLCMDDHVFNKQRRRRLWGSFLAISSYRQWILTWHNTIVWLVNKPTLGVKIFKTLNSSLNISCAIVLESDGILVSEFDRTYRWVLTTSFTNY
jgi:hypothetical protein